LSLCTISLACINECYFFRPSRRRCDLSEASRGKPVPTTPGDEPSSPKTNNETLSLPLSLPLSLSLSLSTHARSSSLFRCKCILRAPRRHHTNHEGRIPSACFSEEEEVGSGGGFTATAAARIKIIYDTTRIYHKWIGWPGIGYVQRGMTCLMIWHLKAGFSWSRGRRQKVGAHAVRSVARNSRARATFVARLVVDYEIVAMRVRSWGARLVFAATDSGEGQDSSGTQNQDCSYFDRHTREWT
jgi:hypothetical protein